MSKLQNELTVLLREQFVGSKANEEMRLRAEATCREWVQKKRALGLWPFEREPSIRLMPKELNSLAIIWPAECIEVSNAAPL